MKRALAVMVVCAVLAGCAGIPTDGPVREGDSDVAQQPPFVPLLQGPEPDASPRAIVQGFLAASAGGAISGFEIAREFLAGDAAVEWDPLAQVTIFDSRQVEPSYDESTGTYTYRVPVAAIVDASGVMTEVSEDVHADITFSVREDEFGNYRISSLEDGIVMSAADFARFFRPLKLYFASADLSTMVPELRWFASNDQISTAVARELVEGPSPWLADAVVTGFPPGSTLDVNAVVVEEGVAQVALATGSAGDVEQRALAAEQFDLTLRQLTAVQEVETTVGGVPMEAEGSLTLDQAPLPPEEAAVIAGGRLGLFDGTSIRVTPIDIGVLPDDAGGLALSYDGTTVAVVVDGSVATSTALADAPTLEPYDPAVEVPAQPPLVALDPLLAGADLVAPSWDAHGWVWSTERSSSGVVMAGTPGGESVALDASWLAGRAVQAVSVSRDGTRLAVLSRATGDVQSLEVSSIVRDASGAPLGLSQPLALAPSIQPSIDVEWADDVAVVALGADPGQIDEAQVGGWTTAEALLAGAQGITARNGVRSLLAINVDNALVARAGNSWDLRVEGVTAVAYAG